MMLFADNLVTLLNGDSRFSVLVKSISMLGGPNDKNFPFLNNNDRMKVVANIHNKLHGKIKLELEPGNGFVCYASKANSFIIRSNGNINKCTVALQNDKNMVGVINSDGTISINENKINYWLRGLLSQKETELQCPNISSA